MRLTKKYMADFIKKQLKYSGFAFSYTAEIWEDKSAATCEYCGSTSYGDRQHIHKDDCEYYKFTLEKEEVMKQIKNNNKKGRSKK